MICSLRLIILPSEDAEPMAKSFCVDGLLQSPAINISPNESTSWSTEITLLARGEFEVGVIIQEQLKDKTKDCRRWIGEPCRVKSDPTTEERRSARTSSAETRGAE